MPTESCRARLFRNNLDQVLVIPRGFELTGDEAVIRQQDGYLVIESRKKPGLLATLCRLEPIEDEFPDINEGLTITPPPNHG